MDLEVVSKNLFGLADLFTAQDFYLHQTLKIIVIGDNKNSIFASF